MKSTFIYFSVIAKMLLEKGVNVNVSTEYGDTALHWAMFSRKSKNVDLVHLMIAKGGNVNALNRKKELPLYAAINLRAPIQVC